jgi:hypothetical protein
MRRRILIQDMEKQQLILTYWDAVGEWRPDQPGFVKAAKKDEDNPANEIVESAWAWMDLFLFTDSGKGDFKPEVIMKLRRIRKRGSTNWDNKSGFGELSWQGGAAKMVAGTLKWWLL